MRIAMGSWGKRVIIGLTALLVLGFGVGTLTTRSTRLDESSGQASLQPDGATSGLARTGVADAYDANKTLATSGGAGTSAAPGAPEADKAAALALPQQIVKTSEMSIQVKRGTFGAAWDRVFDLATRLGGHVAFSSRGEGGPRPIPLDVAGAGEKASNTPAFGDITIRVPSSKFEAALKELRAYGTVKADSVSSEDVTQQVVDLDARLRNARAQETLLLKFLSQAKNVGESLNVQRSLSSTQEQIEQLEGQQRQLKSQTSLATIALHLTEPGAAAAAREDETGPSFGRAWHTAMVGLVRIATVAMIGVLWLVPFAILGLLALVFVRRLRAHPQN